MRLAFGAVASGKRSTSVSKQSAFVDFEEPSVNPSKNGKGFSQKAIAFVSAWTLFNQKDRPKAVCL